VSVATQAHDRPPAVIFDCDGVLADTERHGHLPAFNQMFAELDLPVRWTEEEYREKLQIGGGKERLASLLTDEFVVKAGLPRDREQQLEHVRRWHRRKTEIYGELVRSGALPPRPGIRRVAADALDAGWELAVASTSAEESVVAVLEHAVGTERAGRFRVFAGDVVARKKPAPDIYQHALERMHRPPAGSIAVEDSRNGLLAAAGAGLACVVTVNGYTADERFDEAALVVSSLGDPDGERADVIDNRCGADVHGFVTLRDLVVAMRQTRETGSDGAAEERAPTTGRS
jgi:HAD superfamily hydrolase (TIGR01509 family)